MACRLAEPEIPEETRVPVSAPELMEGGKLVEEQADPGIVELGDDEAIFNASYNCLTLFERIQRAEDGNYSEVGTDTNKSTSHESSLELELESGAATYNLPSSDQTQLVSVAALRNNFAIWVDFTGALSLKESSLDARLRGFTEISSMVVELLDMVYRNLQRQSIYQPTVADASDDCGAVPDRIHPDNYRLELSSVGVEEWEDALKAVGDALDRLHFLAGAIRKASAKRLEYDVNTFLSEEDALFRRDAACYVRWKFPGARKALCEQLGDSIAVRRRMLLNRRRHEKKLAIRRTPEIVAPTPSEHSDSVATASKPVQLIPVSNQVTKAKPPPDAATIASRPAAPELLMRHITKSPGTILTSIRSSAPSSAEVSFGYPPAPRAKPRAKFVPCPYCFTPLEAAKLRNPKNNYWLNHIDRDLQPYICLFPECAEALTFFSRQHEWKAHMEEAHSLDWPQKVHSLVFYCDLGHEGQDPPQFENEAEWREHMQDLNSHRGRYSKPPTKTQLNALAARKQQLVPRERDVCPLCNDIILPNIQPPARKDDPTADANRLTEHIAQHIKSLSLMSLPCLESFPEEQDRKSSVNENSFKRVLHTGSNPQTPSQPSGIERVSVFSLEFDYETIPSMTSDNVDPKPLPGLDPKPYTDADPLLDEIWNEILESKLKDDEEDPILIALRQPISDVLMSEHIMLHLLSVTDDGTFSLSQFDSDYAVPPYAILSHTWLADAEEPTFEDLINGTGEKKRGYEKIRFCGEQARQHGLQYFWVDTCCINKANKAELSHAINSMFHWYHNATRCFVYLSDVSCPLSHTNDELIPRPWESDFQTSRWFTRGWTLQELLAPYSVEFFSREHQRLGDKSSLRQQIHEITGVPHGALQGCPLSQFSVVERFRWTEHRNTTLKEDKAYSLLGIFNVYLTPRYGEGQESAFKRLNEEINKQNKCIQDLTITDPRDDKERIEQTKGGLLKDSYRWILENADFQKWRDDKQSRLLWIKGDPGKGKTMLICGIVNELEKSMSKKDLLSYFFCQATDSRINNAIAVLRGLMYLLVDQQPALIPHILKKYEYAGKAIFEDVNAWFALTEIFSDMLRDPSLNVTYLIIDALDECVTDLPKLLDFVAKHSSMSSRVKWIVSSRNWPVIEIQLGRASHIEMLSLELNAQSVSTAVRTFIELKVSRLAQLKKYDERTRDAVLEHLASNANNTFLWVALVCHNLEMTPRWNVVKMLNSFPPGLISLYWRMMQQISNSDDAELCRQVLASIALMYRPITLKELVTLVEQLGEINNDMELREIIGLCCSFLTLREDTIYFVHESAKDFLLTKAAEVLFPSGKKDFHHAIVARSLEIMSRTLKRDMYDIAVLGYPIDDIEQPDCDPLAMSRYSCIYWVDHLRDSDPISSASYTEDLQDGGVVDTFLKDKYLYWLEALSLCKNIPKGIVSMSNLLSLVQRRKETTSFTELVYDSYRFIMYHREVVEHNPLQAYASALLFSPTRSLVRRLFQHDEPEWIRIKPATGDTWSSCLQTLEAHSGGVRSVAFSPDLASLASASDDKTVKIWDASSGKCLQTLEGHSSFVTSVAVSSDSRWVVTGSDDRTAKIWDASSGEYLQTLEGHSSSVTSVAVSSDSRWVVTGSDDRTAKIWDAVSGRCLQTLEGHSSSVTSVAVSSDSRWVVTGSDDHTAKIWDAGSGRRLQTLEGHSSSVTSVAVLSDSRWVVTGSDDRTAKIWDAGSGRRLQTLEGHSSSVTSVAVSSDSRWVVTGSDDRTAKIWDAVSGQCLQTLGGHSDNVWSVAFSPDSARLASASLDSTIKIWDASSGAYLQMLEGHSDNVWSVAFSPDSARLASASLDSTIKIWDASSGACLQTLEGHSYGVRLVAFSPDSARLASASDDKTVKIWDVSSGGCLLTLEIGKVLSNISFDTTGSRLHTDIGTIAIDVSALNRPLSVTNPQKPQYQSVGVSSDGVWITYNAENVVWLPPEYRPRCSAVSGKTIGIGARSGKVWLCIFKDGDSRDS